MNEGHPSQDTSGTPPRGVNARRGGRLAAIRRWTLRALLGVTVALALFLALTEMGRYLARAGVEEAKILWARRPIADLVADSSVSPLTRQKLVLVLDARTFARDSLGLDVGQSFTTFSQLQRDTLVLLLSAAYRDQLRYHRWWFPIVGWVPYKGYFDFGRALAAERDFRERGFDSYLRPVSAFSTLGFFNDPLLSTTLRADTLALANTVIHELVHNTFYARGQAEFNESFANFVGARGSAEFYRLRGAPLAVAQADARWGDEQVLARFWKGLHADMDSVFRAHPGDSARAVRLALRDSVYAAARTDLIARIAPQLRTVGPQYGERVRLDNAALLARRIYLTDVELFDSVYVRENRNLKRAIERIIDIARSNEGEPFEALRVWVLAPSP